VSCCATWVATKRFGLSLASGIDDDWENSWHEPSQTMTGCSCLDSIILKSRTARQRSEQRTSCFANSLVTTGASFAPMLRHDAN
jgi:hypothetical protein